MKNQIIELKNEITFLKPKPANEVTDDFIENELFSRPSFSIIWFARLNFFWNSFKICIYNKWCLKLLLIVFKHYFLTFLWHFNFLLTIDNKTIFFVFVENISCCKKRRQYIHQIFDVYVLFAPKRIC